MYRFPTVKLALLFDILFYLFYIIFLVLYFHLLLIGSFIRIRFVFFVSWSLLQKLNLTEKPLQKP